MMIGIGSLLRFRLLDVARSMCKSPLVFEDKTNPGMIFWFMFFFFKIVFPGKKTEEKSQRIRYLLPLLP